MNARHLLLFATVFVAGRIDAAPPPAKMPSASRSQGQFVVYCADAPLRRQTETLAQETKADVYELLGESGDRWKLPIIISLAPPDGRTRPPVLLKMIATPGGAKIDIDAEIGHDLAAVNLRKQVVRAVLLEIGYRGRPPIRGGEEYREAPWWLVDGAIEIFRRRELGVDSDLFQRLVENNKFPSIEQFLALRADGLGATAQAIDSAFAMGLVQSLIDQPNGRANLGRLVRRWPETGGEPMAALKKDFPSLAEGGATLQKWWTLNLARLGASNRYRGLSLGETDKQLAALLEIELVIDKAGTKKKFAVAEYNQFLKLPAARAALTVRRQEFLALSAQANALLRPVIADYDEILALLIRGKTQKLTERIEDTEGYRTAVLTRMDKIADYMNWYEATQLGTRTHEFDSYLKAVDELSRDENHVFEPIKRYLDTIEKEYGPSNGRGQ